ncbi:MAG: type III pantothenate kinase [Chromatiales bacterium]|nr:type III pantothenate kinase [Chromatiales bacterium]
MKLLVDLGNSRVKWACMEGGRFTASGAFEHLGLGPQALASEVGRIPGCPHEVRLSSVADSGLSAALRKALAGRFGCPLRVAATARSAGRLLNGYHDHRQLGVDRWLALRAAQAEWPERPCIVIDAGTAVTLDALAASGQHLGGLILPGLRLVNTLLAERAAALSGLATAGLPEVAGTWWARDTASACASGPLLALVALIERCVAELAHGERRDQVQLVLTGGDAGQLAQLLPPATALRPQLVLSGLALDMPGLPDA